MPAAVVKGILVSISIIAALSLAVLENPIVQAWLEEQRQKVIELLRSIGEELDPESRRQAEAFAYEGRTPANDPGLQREASASKEAAAVATGMSLASPSAVRRIPVQGRVSPEEAEERRRKGREYLAKRNAGLFELQHKRKATQEAGAATPPSPTTFDDLVDTDGKLRNSEDEMESLPSPPAMEPLPAAVQESMRVVERHLAQPIPVAASSSTGMTAFALGSQLADPFGDEFAMDRSVTPRPMERSTTPKPPVPPKVRLDEEAQESSPLPTTANNPHEHAPEQDSDELSFEEQIAIALQISEEENSATAATVQQNQSQDEADLRAAIAASLREMDGQQAAHAVAHAERITSRPALEDSQPLVDLRPALLLGPPAMRSVRSDWDRLFDPQVSISRETAPRARAPPSTSADSEDLYRLTPELTRARLASHDAQSSTLPRRLNARMPYDPIREAATANTDSPNQAMESSFYSAPSSVTTPPQLIDVDVNPVPAATSPATLPAPMSEVACVAFDSDDLEFASARVSRTHSQARSETSTLEAVDVTADSDVDMLSDEEGDGVLTPDSWTEVGSRDGESETGDDERRQAVV